MSEGCFNCTQKAKELNEQRDTIVSRAQSAANESGEWYGIYYDEFNEPQIIRADVAKTTGIPIRQYVSPKL